MSLVDECISCTSKLWTVKDGCAIKSATCVMAFESVAKITGENYLNPTAVSDDLDEHIIYTVKLQVRGFGICLQVFCQLH